ncbi:3-dehydroquinate synthase [Eubacteriales bacterium OttesenSCG-928-G02]|nr:3-dehydroquinate synthase [Eubacteriales bacterium OttesenSCG-928-G02]
MKKIFINASTSYNIIIEEDIFNILPSELNFIVPQGKIMLLSDDNVYNIYADKIKKSLNSFKVFEYIIDHGESSKNLETISNILNYMGENSFTRSDIILAVGGGIIGDIAGFAASVYMRGIKFVQVPTTLLAMIDSSVGGKTGVNLKSGKNLAGAFHQPSLVLCGTDFLKTLPRDEFANGYAEIIKYGMICSEFILNSLESDTFNFSDIISKCIEIKKSFVEEDEFDTGNRQLLNFGHTVGHAIEKLSDFTISHGKAVAVGMAVIAKAAVAEGEFSESEYMRLIKLIQKYKLPVKCDIDISRIFKTITKDKKINKNEITLVTPVAWGKCKLNPMQINLANDYLMKGVSV